MLNGPRAGSAAPRPGGGPALKLPARTRLAMAAMGFIPVLTILAGVAPILAVVAGWTSWPAALLSPTLIYLLPPLAVRIRLAGAPLPSGTVRLESREFLRWWWTAQWQVLFLRLPALEELLRLFPGAYSLWLRLWGAEVGSMVYWAPGVTVLDRPLLRVGDRVAFGMGVRVNPHALAPLPDGDVGLHIGRVTIEDDVLVGGYSLLLPGCSVAAGSVTPPLRAIHAFTRWDRAAQERSTPSGA